MRPNRRTLDIRRLLTAASVTGTLLCADQIASAQESGPTIAPTDCMQRIFIGQSGAVSNANRLNCTANDIRLSRATSVSPATCVEGTTFDLTATFETAVTANARYDAGFFFRIDGGSNARGDGTTASGECSLSALDPAVAPALELDGDTCGDLNSGTYELTFTIEGVLCSDSDGDGFLNLPNCTSWHSNHMTTCDIDDPFQFEPDTKSKCVCDDTFQVPVTVEKPSGAVTKKATQAAVTYEVTVKNNSATRSVSIDSIVDDLYGDVADPTNDAIDATDCDDLIGDTLAPGETSEACRFVVTYSDPGTDGPLKNTVTAEIVDTENEDNSVEVSGSTTIDVELNVAP